MRNDRERAQVEEVAEHAGTHYRDGVLVVVRCYRVPGASASRGLGRLEVCLEGHGQRAVFDVPTEDEDLLQDYIEEAVQTFITTIRIRSGSGNGSPPPK